MDTRELLKEVRKIEIKTKGLSNQLFSGEYHSAFKGRGMSFSEVREYVVGDEVRNIDWNVTARTGDPHVKVFEEERELTVMLLVDISPSAFFGTQNKFKHEFMTELSAVLAFSALQNNDKVGLMLFSEKVELYIPPKKGKKHILRIIRELVNHEPSGKSTDLNTALVYLNNVIKKRSICFVLSDFICEGYKDALRIASRKHDVVGLHVFDPREQELPPVGILDLADLETGEKRMIDTADQSFRLRYEEFFRQHREYSRESFLKARSELLSLPTDQSYFSALHTFFKKRAG